MKLSDGATRPAATGAFLLLFAGGALVQAVGMKARDLGPAYIFVLGVEALLTLGVSALYLREPYTPSRIAAITLVLVGIVWLRRA